MSSIPNLNTLRSGRRGPRLRERRGSRGRGHRVILGEEDIETSRDQVIQQTDNDASSSRMSAVESGYLEDPFAKSFFPAGQEVARRYPIINRGTYVRTKGIDRLVSCFLNTDPDSEKQIVSLGAGSDSRFFRMCAGKHNVAYHELDFESNVTPKRATIRSSEQLSRMALGQEGGSTYHLHAVDLRDLTQKSPPAIPGIAPDVPTLLVSECCLCYLPPEQAISVLQYFTMNLQGPLAMLLYEPIRPFDAFGRTMVSNLASRGIELRTVKRYFSLEGQRERLKLAGFKDGQGARDVHEIWSSSEWISGAERERVEKLEWLDEVEEWKLLASHYCIAWAWRGAWFEQVWRDIAGGRSSSEAQDDDFERI
ncbi:Leucine carboxyl methyltransferase 1 [Lecanosticta acicola]|uniref:Leucine carboxyl methyltransferase 1 n=1 Tax=Lecanosticta acicola TaxID=111012 RepID=A0AAI9EDS4_9PEZI|nr:Leucine carboxyl methyltransferase 1 [Lecanosticta acicola]